MPNITKKCRVSGKEFIIDERDQAYYERIGVPLPTLCPEERRRRRYAQRNERNLYRRKYGLTGEFILSNMGEHTGIPVYGAEAW